MDTCQTPQVLRDLQDDTTGSELVGMTFAALAERLERERPLANGATEIALYQSWINANPTSPFLFAAWYNIGVALAQGGDRERACVAYRNALALKPTLHAAAINLGLSLEALGQKEAALNTWQQALQPDEARTALLNQRARLLETLGQLDEAERTLRTSLTTQPDQPDAIQHWVHIRQKLCRWPVLSAEVPGLSPTSLLRSAGPLGVLALTDDVAEQATTAAAWVARKTHAIAARLSPPQGYHHDRIRLGYLSSDFCSHAMSYLIAELFERHDRNRFELFGYCASPEDGSDIRRRVIAAFDHFRIVRPLADEQAAQLIRADEVDILVDLNGLTSGARVQVLRYKPAPIQATYLGFIGPVPLPELDYVFCDRFVIPPEQADAYRPTPMPVATMYQANDSKRAIGRTLTRADAGLPEDRFVLCCFSNHYKITEDMFAAWMAILHQADNTVLWLTRDNATSHEALRRAAAEAGIAAERLIFSERTGPDLYMSRLGLPDLFLDTFPYNAGTIASDAIRMGLPLLTLCGRSFASRMAGRLLDAIGAHEGITSTPAEYVATAVRLASDPTAHREFKAHFTPEAWSASIGNIAQFTAEYEATLTRLAAGLRQA